MKLVISRLRSVPSCFVLAAILLCGCGVIEARLNSNNNNNNDGSSSSSRRSLTTTNLTLTQEKLQDHILKTTSPPPQTTLLAKLQEKINDLILTTAEDQTSIIETMKSWHSGTTTDYNKGDISIQSPSNNPDDVLFLFLSRSDGEPWPGLVAQLPT